MDAWQVIYTENAYDDLEAIQEYITWKLRAPEAAQGQADRIEAAINDLSDFPMRHPVYPHEPWHSGGVRYRVVDHYLVFYHTDEALRRVIVLRIMYHRRIKP